jgi:D-alanyl-lipoteichoic acid acyltransferase DltB (MBOAT superfamily)
MFQIYGDFSGYTDKYALGMSKLFGIDLLKNSKLPVLLQRYSRVGRRWHISLSSLGLKDYLYIPLGGSKGSKSSRSAMYIIFWSVVFGMGFQLDLLACGDQCTPIFIITDKNRSNIAAVQ